MGDGVELFHCMSLWCCNYRLESLNMKCLLGAAVFSVVELGLLWENVLISASTLLSDEQGESVNTGEKEQRGNILIVCDLFNFIHLQCSMIKKNRAEEE